MQKTVFISLIIALFLTISHNTWTVRTRRGTDTHLSHINNKTKVKQKHFSSTTQNTPSKKESFELLRKVFKIEDYVPLHQVAIIAAQKADLLQEKLEKNKQKKKKLLQENKTLQDKILSLTQSKKVTTPFIQLDIEITSKQNTNILLDSEQSESLWEHTNYLWDETYLY